MPLQSNSPLITFHKVHSASQLRVWSLEPHCLGSNLAVPHEANCGVMAMSQN